MTHQSCFFKDISHLKRTCQRILNDFEETKNQFLVVYNLPENVMRSIDNREISLGVSFHFMFFTWERLGIIKIMPSAQHDICTEELKGHYKG